MKKYPGNKELQEQKKISSMTIGDGTDKFSLNEHLRRYKEAYAHGLQQSKETGYSFNVQHPLPVFVLPITYVDDSGIKKTRNVVLETWMNSKFLDKDILENIKKSKEIDLLDIRYSVIDSNIDRESLVKIVREYISSHSVCVDVLIENYCEVQKQMLDFYQSKKQQLSVLKASGKEILDVMKCPLIQNRGLVSPISLEQIMKATASYTGKTYMDIEKYKENIFETLHIFKDSEYENIDTLMTNLRDVDAMIENMEEQKKVFTTEIMDKIKTFDKKRDGILQIDSRYLFFENGNDMYDDVLSQSVYKEYFVGECDNIEKNFDALKPYCHPFFVDLGCGAGAKDAILMKKYTEHNIPLNRAVFMDGSMSSLVSCYAKLKNTNKESNFRYNFSTDWIDKLVDAKEAGYGKGLRAFHNPNIPSNNEMLIGQHTLSEGPTTFTMRGGTLGCFGTYKEKFLQDMGAIMKKGDIFLISNFDTPSSQEEIAKLIGKYKNEESEKFVLNFLQKIGIAKDHMKFDVEYNDDKIDIFVDIRNPEGKGVEISAFGEQADIENGTRMKIHESQRFNRNIFEKLLKDSGSGLSIETIVKDKYGGPDIYVVKK